MRCITINRKGTILCVQFLSDRAFNAGFRVCNPEFSASATTLQLDNEKLNDILESVDALDPADFHNYKKFQAKSPRQFAEWKMEAGLDR